MITVIKPSEHSYLKDIEDVPSCVARLTNAKGAKPSELQHLQDLNRF